MSIAQTSAEKTNKLAFLQGGGEMGAFMRSYNWEQHPMGSPENWPESLKTIIRMMLNSAFPMFIWWSEGLYMFHNDAYLPALGNKHPKALGERASDMWAEIWDQIGVITADILKTGNYFYADSLKLMLERKGFSEETYWTFSYSPAFDNDGKINGIFCACTEVSRSVISHRRMQTLKDISDATTLVQTLEHACQNASNILNNNPLDIPFNLIYLFEGDTKTAKLYGKAGDGIVANAPEHLNFTNTADNPFTSIKQTKQPLVLGEKAENLEEIRSLLGFDATTRATILPVTRPGQEQLIGFCISGISEHLEYDKDYQDFHQLLIGQIATSITNVHVREEANRQQAYLQEIFQQAPVGITIIRGADYIIDLANPGVCEIWGRKQEEVLGKTVLEALPEVAEQGIIELLDGVYTTGIPFVANELPVVLERNGKLEKVYLNFVYQPLYGAQGTITGLIAVAIDITEQVEARLKIEVMNRELLAINADLDNFVYAASHDLKAPISNIEGLMKAFVEHLPSGTMENTEVQRVLNLIHNSIDRFKRAISDLTEVAKIQRQGDEDITRINLAEVVENVRLDFESVIREKDASIDIQIAPDSEIEFSAKNVRSIVYNLLSNAIKYSSPDRKLHIKVTTEVRPDFTVLSVTDNGLGFNPSDESKIFTMFKRLHNHVEGSGIGLYIVKRILETAGGHIELESEPNKGSTFRVYFKR